jgi:hypothetical protein
MEEKSLSHIAVNAEVLGVQNPNKSASNRHNAAKKWNKLMKIKTMQKKDALFCPICGKPVENCNGHPLNG